MKKFTLLFICLFCCVVMAGCQTNKNPKSNPSASSDDAKFAYCFSFEDLPDEIKKEMSKNIVLDYTQEFEVGEINIKIDSVTYTRDTKKLEDNFYELPANITVNSNKIDENNVIALVQFTFTNKATAAQEFYVNSFNIYSLSSAIAEECSYSYAFYQDSVHAPKQNNRKYAKLLFDANESKTVTVGFACDAKIMETQNNYITIGSTGSTSDPTYFVKLPENGEYVQ
ncbi:MAG: hypothetical protein RR576_03235 [Oscillospiraceae bacterium]